MRPQRRGVALAEAPSPAPGVSAALADPARRQAAAEDYEAAVSDVIARIAAGDIFQANIARAWTELLALSAR